MNIDSFVIVISRRYPIAKCLKAIAKADIPRKDLYLLLYLDTQDRLLIDYCKNWIDYHGQKWLSANMIKTNRTPVYTNRVEDYPEKWERIIENLKKINTHLDFSEIVFMVEDDTIISKNAFKKLYRRIKSDKEIGCIQGVEALRKAGEHGPCGAWLLDLCIRGKIRTKVGLGAKKTGIQQIDGGGYYCWAYRQEAIKKIKMRWSLNGWCGPDIWTWYDIGQNGWKTLIDWSVWCGHIEDDEKILTPEGTRNWLYDFSNGTEQSPKMDFNYDYKNLS